jgi:hypothetical protein
MVEAEAVLVPLAVLSAAVAAALEVVQIGLCLQQPMSAELDFMVAQVEQVEQVALAIAFHQELE